MLIGEIIHQLEQLANPNLQESYDNAGLLTGNKSQECSGVLCTLDCTEDVVEEAISKKCNLIVAHHPIIFKGLKSVTGKNYVERVIINAIKNDICIYAIHTNLDNIRQGVNMQIAQKLGLKNIRTLSEKSATLKKIYTFVPVANLEKVRNALFEAGAGQIGNYDSCSFNTSGNGTFKALDGAKPFVGNPGELHQEEEIKLEAIFPFYSESKIVEALKMAHPYEEVAYDVISLSNPNSDFGSGFYGDLENPLDPNEFLKLLKTKFGTPAIRFSGNSQKKIQHVGLCGGAGNFLISNCLGKNLDAFVTADLKYHEFFDTEDKMLLVDIGHYESEQFTIDLLAEYLVQKFPTFAVQKTATNTNPVQYFT